MLWALYRAAVVTWVEVLLLPSPSCRLAGFTSLVAAVVVRECSPYPPRSGVVRGRWSPAAQPRTAWTYGSDNCRGRAPPGYPRPVDQQRYGGSMPGWQITLIAIGTALLVAAVALLIDRARIARRRSTATVV